MSDDAVHADIHINAPVQEVWDFALDAQRLCEWVSIHRKLEEFDEGPPHKGMTMKQALTLRGAAFKVTWELTECQDLEYAKWEGRGPARSYARTEYSFTEAADGGTDFHYVNEFKAPMGALGKVAAKALVGGLPQREADKSLARLKEILEK